VNYCTAAPEEPGFDRGATEWMVVVVVPEGDDPEGLALNLSWLLDDVAPTGPGVVDGHVYVPLLRQAPSVTQAAFAGLHDVEHWGYQPEGVVAGEPDAPYPLLEMRRAGGAR
jgi:hypothetical protein